jgi:hypothetical protein
MGDRILARDLNRVFIKKAPSRGLKIINVVLESPIFYQAAPKQKPRNTGLLVNLLKSNPFYLVFMAVQ